MNKWCFVFVNGLFLLVNGFIPHPAIRLGGQAGDSITHTEMVQLGFIQSLAKFFLDTKTGENSKINAEELTKQHTIDELYQLIHPNWDSSQIFLNTYPLKSIIDLIQVRDALVDLNPLTKNLPSAHFDAESFVDANHRIMELRNKVIADVNTENKDLQSARGKIGDLLHTLQDFYSHSNWIEMGRTEPNKHIGLREDIGSIAPSNQPTCRSDGCTKIVTKCNLLQSLILSTCPMEYYDCTNNLLDDVNKKGLLTSGYVSGQKNANDESVSKPKNVEKCSHGSVMDSSAHASPIGGINKDTMTPVYSPHYHLHFDAAKVSVAATEQFFNDLRKDIGDANFDRLFAINPTEQDIKLAEIAIAEKKQFHFLTATLSVGLSTSDLNFEKTLKQRIKQILSTLFGIKDLQAPTYDLSDKGFSNTDANIHAGALIIDNSKSSKTSIFSRRHYRWNRIK